MLFEHFGGWENALNGCIESSRDAKSTASPRLCSGHVPDLNRPLPSCTKQTGLGHAQPPPQRRSHIYVHDCCSKSTRHRYCRKRWGVLLLPLLDVLIAIIGVTVWEVTSQYSLYSPQHGCSLLQYGELG